MRRVSTRVLPEPAPAITTRGPAVVNNSLALGRVEVGDEPGDHLFCGLDSLAGVFLAFPVEEAEVLGPGSGEPLGSLATRRAGADPPGGPTPHLPMLGRNWGHRRHHPRHYRDGRRVQWLAPTKSVEAHSHSIVPGGLEVTSYATRFTPGTSLITRLEIRSSTS